MNQWEIHQYLSNAISRQFQNIESGVRESLIESIIERLDEYAPRKRGLIVEGRRRYYAIKNSDLDIFESLLPLIPPALVAQLASNDIAIDMLSSSISLITALIILLFRFKKKHISLDARSGLILLKIKDNPGTTKIELLKSVAGITFTKNELNRIIDGLKHARKSDGTQISLITEDNNNRLYTADV